MQVNLIKTLGRYADGDIYIPLPSIIFDFNPSAAAKTFKINLESPELVNVNWMDFVNKEEHFQKFHEYIEMYKKNGKIYFESDGAAYSGFNFEVDYEIMREKFIELHQFYIENGLCK
jgi:hypothetical protein